MKSGDSMYYQISHQLIETPTLNEVEPAIALYTYEEWQRSQAPASIAHEFYKSYSGVHFCKLESHSTFLAGTLSIPTKHNFKTKKKVLFYFEPYKITFIDDSDFIKNILLRLNEDKFWETPSLEAFFSDFLQVLIANDLVYVEELENRISKLESAAINGDVPHFNHKMMEFRKELLIFHYYYSQLIDLAEVLMENENDYFETDRLNLFQVFIRRVERLQNTILMLREYATQVREEYQAQVDIKQNNTMRILTAVTSIFLPLTLIAGWYGMNFSYMPELTWVYGYPFVIVISIVTIFICLWICKKKKFL